MDLQCISSFNVRNGANPWARRQFSRLAVAAACVLLPGFASGQPVVSAAAGPAPWQIENEQLRITLLADARLTVEDKRAKYTWEQAASGDLFRVSSVDRAGTNLSATLEAGGQGGPSEIKMRVSLRPDSSEVRIELDVPPETTLQHGLAFPYPFRLGRDVGHVVYPKAQGFVIPMNAPQEDFFRRDTSQVVSWIGVTDLEKGCVMIVDTNDDASWSFVPGGAREGPAYQISWLPSEGKWGYARCLIYDFAAEGGYVRLAKLFRAYAQKKGYVKTLAVKAQENPNVLKMAGSPDIYVWGDETRSPGFLDELKRSGIDKAQVNWDNCHGPEIRPDYVARAKALGYVPGVYDIYQRILDAREIQAAGRRVTPHESGLFGLPANAGPALVRAHEDGSLAAQPRWWGQVYMGCIRAFAPFACARIAAEQQEFGYLGRFFDTMGTDALEECYAPDHPETRADDRRWREKIVQCALEQHLVIGSESCKDWLVPYMTWVEGRMQTGPAPRDQMIQENDLGPWDGTDPKEPLDRWKIPSRIGMTYHPTPAQLAHELDIRYRVPLWELVYHDAVMDTWHWHVPQQKIEGLWDFKDLQNILYGTRPTFNLYQSIWQDKKARFLQTYRDVCRWHNEIAFDEMIDHRWLTPDHKVQQTSFSSGRSAIVNFSAEPRHLADGRSLEAWGFLCLPALPAPAPRVSPPKP